MLFAEESGVIGCSCFCAVWVRHLVRGPASEISVRDLVREGAGWEVIEAALAV